METGRLTAEMNPNVQSTGNQNPQDVEDNRGNAEQTDVCCREAQPPMQKDTGETRMIVLANPRKIFRNRRNRGGVNREAALGL